MILLLHSILFTTPLLMILCSRRATRIGIRDARDPAYVRIQWRYVTSLCTCFVLLHSCSSVDRSFSCPSHGVIPLSCPLRTPSDLFIHFVVFPTIRCLIPFLVVAAAAAACCSAIIYPYAYAYLYAFVYVDFHSILESQVCRKWSSELFWYFD